MGNVLKIVYGSCTAAVGLEYNAYIAFIKDPCTPMCASVQKKGQISRLKGVCVFLFLASRLNSLRSMYWVVVQFSSPLASPESPIGGRAHAVNLVSVSTFLLPFFIIVAFEGQHGFLYSTGIKVLQNYPEKCDLSKLRHCVSSLQFCNLSLSLKFLSKLFPGFHSTMLKTRMSQCILLSVPLLWAPHKTAGSVTDC